MLNFSSILTSVVGSKLLDNIFGGPSSGTELAPRPIGGEPTASIFGETVKAAISAIPGQTALGSNIGVDVYQPSQETKISGAKMMENGPVYGASAAILPFAQSAARQLGRSIFGGGTGSAIGGALTGYGVGSMLAGDQCGCEPKPFVRMDKCGRPIITRAMQAKAKDMVQNCGMEAAAQMLGVDIQLLGEIAFKKFKPRAKGISGAQLKTAKRVARQMHSAQKAFKAACNGR
jgi:hypothetical protein